MIESLERELPAVTLLLGQPGETGKLAGHLLRHHQVHQSCIVRIPKLDAEMARAIVRSCETVPSGGLRVIVIDLDSAGEAAQNIILKTLEEAPESFRFILMASVPPLATVASRSQVFRLASHGRAAEPVAGEEEQRERSVVMATIRAASALEWEAVNQSMRGWTPRHVTLLLEWSAAAAAGSRKDFPEGLSGLMPREKALAVWKQLRASPLSPLMALAALYSAYAGLSS